MEEHSFLEKIDAHKGIIAKVIHLYADDPEDKKDLRQEIIYQSWKSYESFRGDAKFSTWLYKISLNVSLTFIGKKKKKSGWGELEHEMFSSHPPELSERADKLYRAIKQLGDIDRGIIILHLDGYDNEEISAMTGISKNNAGVKLHRIKQQLTEILNQKKMDLQSEWNNMNEELKATSASPAIDKSMLQKESKGLYETLRKNLGYKLMWIRILSVPMLIGAFFAEGGLRYLLIGAFLVYEIARMLMVRKLKHMPPGLDYSEVTKQMLSRQLQMVKDMLKAEQLWGYLFIPLSTPAGLIAYQLFAGKELSALYTGPHFLLYAVMCVVFAGLGLIMARKMNTIAFSGHIKRLAENIEQMN